MSESTALAVYGKVQDPLKFSTDMALAIGSLVGAQSKEQGQAVALQCLCEGITPIEFARKYHLIQGKPTMKTQAMLAEFRMNHGGSYKIVSQTHKLAEIHFKDKAGEPYDRKMSRLDIMLSRWPWEKNPGWQKCVAQVRSLVQQGKNEDEIWLTMLPNFKDNYGTEIDWKNMLFNRLVGDSLRAICPEMAAGVYTPEEMIDVIDGEILPTKPAPMTASQFTAAQQQVAAASQPASTVAVTSAVASEPAAEQPPFDANQSGGQEEVVVDAEFELGGQPQEPLTLSPAQERLIAKCMEQFNEAFGAQSQQALAKALSDRKVAMLAQLPGSELQTISDRLTAKIAQKPKN